MSLTNREKVQLDRYLTSTPYDTKFSSTERRGALPVPDHEIARALRAEIALTWTRMHRARKLHEIEYAQSLAESLLALLDVWQRARGAVRR